MNKYRKTGARAMQVMFLSSLGSMVLAADDIQQQKAQIQAGINILGREVEVLEKNTLMPASTRVGVFFSLASGLEYTPKAVTLLIDGKELSRHEYSHADLRSLRFGAVHTLWQGNLAAGSHQLEAVIEGLDRKQNPVKNSAKAEFQKAASQQALEVRVGLAVDSDDAVFTVQDRGDQL